MPYNLVLQQKPWHFFLDIYILLCVDEKYA